MSNTGGHGSPPSEVGEGQAGKPENVCRNGTRGCRVLVRHDQCFSLPNVGKRIVLHVPGCTSRTQCVCGEEACNCNLLGHLGCTTDAKPTHRCKVCGALWRLNGPTSVQPDGSWSLALGASAGKCCDNVAMGDQIESVSAPVKCLLCGVAHKPEDCPVPAPTPSQPGPKPEMLEKAQAIITDFEVYLSGWPEMARCNLFKHEREKLASLVALALEEADADVGFWMGESARLSAALRASEASVESLRKERDAYAIEADRERTTILDLRAELRAARAAATKAVEALENMSGTFDTPVERRRNPPNDYQQEAIKSMREALAAIRAPRPPEPFVDLAGIAPDFTGGVESSEYIKRRWDGPRRNLDAPDPPPMCWCPEPCEVHPEPAVSESGAAFKLRRLVEAGEKLDRLVNPPVCNLVGGDRGHDDCDHGPSSPTPPTSPPTMTGHDLAKAVVERFQPTPPSEEPSK